MFRSRHPAWPFTVALATALLAAGPLAAQATVSDPRRVPLRPQWELRAEGVAAESPSALAGVGVNVRAGWYVRLGASLAAGARRIDDGPMVGQVRADATLRFLLDPFAERRRGLYGGVGLSAAQLGGGIGARPPVLLLPVLRSRAFPCRERRPPARPQDRQDRGP